MSKFIVSKTITSYYEQVVEADDPIEAEEIAEANEYECISQDESTILVEMEID